MFQGERASCCFCTANRVIVVLSVKYDWKLSMSLCDLWNLGPVFFNTSSGVRSNALFSSDRNIFSCLRNITLLSFNRNIFVSRLSNIAQLSSSRNIFFTSAQ